MEPFTLSNGLNIGLFQFSSQISVTLVSVLFNPPLVNPIYQKRDLVNYLVTHEKVYSSCRYIGQGLPDIPSLLRAKRTCSEKKWSALL